MDKIVCDNLEQIENAAEFIINLCKDSKIWVFKGDLGAGKTTLIKAIAKRMGVLDLVSSPSFSIINEYQDVSGQKYYHFDFYRIKELEEAIDLGVEEYFYSGNYCWVEWAENIHQLIPDDFALIQLEQDSKNRRNISVKIIKNGISN